MNIFVLSTDPVEAATMQCDKHVVKMCTESAQMLSTALWSFGMPAPFERTHVNNKLSIWTRTSRLNFEWHYRHWIALNYEYMYRYDKVHATWEHNVVYKDYTTFPFSSQELTPFILAMPEQYKSADAVNSYRQYYLNEKRRFAKWNKTRKPPKWWTDVLNSTCLC